MKKFFGILFMTLLGLVSCTFEDGNNSSITQPKDVYIKFENAGKPDTRAEEAPKTSSDKVTFSNGYIFFLTGQNSVKKCYHVLPTGSTPVAANNEISINDFWTGASTSGYLFQNVSGEVTKIYIIGNVPDEITDADVRAKTTFAELQKLTIDIKTQSNVNDVLIDGIGALQDQGNNQAKATVELIPLCSRIEIAKLTAEGDVTGYSLQDIYISHFYKEMALNETSDQGSLLKYAAGGGADYSIYSSMCDQTTPPATELGSRVGKVTTPTNTSNVWTYQFLPGNDAARIAPRIVLKIKGVTTGSIGSFDPTKDYYLNIRGFKAVNAGDVDPMKLVRGKVYKIENVKFKENDISDKPNPADIDLTVEVSVANWDIETVEPVM